MKYNKKFVGPPFNNLRRHFENFEKTQVVRGDFTVRFQKPNEGKNVKFHILIYFVF